MSDLTILRAMNIARQIEWKAEDFPRWLRGLELAGEAGEAVNLVKKLERQRLGYAGSRTDVIHLGNELADTIIAADLLAMGYDIDLRRAIEFKFNAVSIEHGFATRIRF